MREDLSNQLTPATALLSIRIIDNQADGLVVRSLGSAADLTYQLDVHRVEKLAPPDVTIIHEAIEHVLLTTEQAA